MFFTSQCSTTRAAATSSCARTDSVSPSTLCVTMTTTAATAQMSPRSAVSGTMTSYSRWGDFKSLLALNSEFNSPSPSGCRISDMWTQRVPLCQRTLPHPEFMGVWWRLRLPRPLGRSPQEPTLHWPRLDPHRHYRSTYVFNYFFFYLFISLIESVD